VNQVDLAGEFFKTASDDPIMQTKRRAAKQFVRQAIFAARKCWHDLRFAGNRTMNRTGHQQNFDSIRAQTFDLFPCGVADAIRANFIREAIENAQDGSFLGEGANGKNNNTDSL
jgi:hypothetical protein